MNTYLLSILLLVILIGIFYTCSKNKDVTDTFEDIYEEKYNDSFDKEDVTEKTDDYKSEPDNEIDLTFNEINLDPHPLDLQVNTHHILTLKRDFDDMVTNWYNKNKDTTCRCQDLM